MINYKDQTPRFRCSTCVHCIIVANEESEYYCKFGIEYPTIINYNLHSDEFFASIHAFHDWADTQGVDRCGICDEYANVGIETISVEP